MEVHEKLSLYDLIIIGAGPAGISLAAEAIHSGIDNKSIIILEKASNHSWSIRKYYPDEKLVTANYKGNDVSCSGVMCLNDSSKDETLSYLDEAIEQNQLFVQYEEQVFEIKKMKNGYYQVVSSKDIYVTRTIAVAIGVLGKPNRPSYPIPSDIKDRVHFDVTSASFSGQSILVVGGGDSASEYAQYLIQKGNKVTLSYRRDEFKRMNDINRESLFALEKEKKIRLLLKSDIEKIESSGKKVKVYFKDQFPNEEFDHIVYALGGSSPKEFLNAIGIKMTKEGPEVTDHFESSEEGIFLVGDIAAGKKGGSINVAFNSAHEAMKEFCQSYLDCRPS